MYKVDIAKELKTEKDIKGFIKAAIEEAKDDTDPSLLAHTLGIAARAKGMLKTSTKAGVNRAGLYRSLTINGNPRLDTFGKVAHSLGYRLSLVPV